MNLINSCKITFTDDFTGKEIMRVCTALILMHSPYRFLRLYIISNMSVIVLNNKRIQSSNVDLVFISTVYVCNSFCKHT